jgi:TATA-box binding protein (TBP) (component of TFIID and TFIIIB)
MALGHRLAIEKLNDDIINKKLCNDTVTFKQSRTVLDFSRFPGLRTKIVTNSKNLLSLLLFINGKIIITGAKTIEQIELYAKNVEHVLLTFYKR